MNEIIFEFPEVPQINFLIDLQGESLYKKWLQLGLGTGDYTDFLNWLRIKGDIGASCEFQVSATHIQWRVVGDFDWINLIALSEFKGEKGDKGNDGFTPYIGINGNWWIDGIDTGENAVAPPMSVIEQYVTGYAEPKKGIDDFYVSAAQVILINDIVNKVTAITGHSLVADTDIAKIHTRNTDSTLLSENGLHSVYIDANGTFHVKNISQVGTTYETHAEQLFTTKNEIILRDGAIAGLGVGEYVGFRAKLYDGVNDGNLVFDRDGWARVGDVGALQKLATIEESPTNGHLMRYNTSTLRLESYDPLLLPVSTAASRAFVSQNGGTIYHTARWFTPTSNLAIAANGLSATITSGQFNSGMTGAKLRLTGGVNEPIITYVSTNQINLSFAVDSAFFGQSVAIADWGVYDRVVLYGVAGAKVYPIFNDSEGNKVAGFGELWNSGGGTRIDYNNVKFPQNGIISWSNSGFGSGTKDLGIRRISDGLMEIYNGVTNGVLRDLKLRSLYADKIIPNSDTTGVVIRNAADGADRYSFGQNTFQFRASNSAPIFELLHVANNNGFRIKILGGSQEITDFQQNNSAGYFIFTNNAGNTELMRLTADKKLGIGTTTPETTLDVNGSTTHRDWVYFPNGNHTGDALDDFRCKTISGVLTFQKCTTANSVRGNGGWTTVSTI